MVNNQGGIFMTKEKIKILIVDDEPKNVSFLEEVLEENDNYDIKTSFSGYEALEKIKNETIHLVLLDIMMPMIGGITVCREIRKIKDRNSLPIIFVSALNQKEKIILGFEAGGNDYIVKPIISEELLARVKSFSEMISLRIKHENMQRDFLAMVVHDLRGPFTGLMGCQDIVSMRAKELMVSITNSNNELEDNVAKFTSFIEKMMSASKRSSTDLLSTVNNILNLSKYEEFGFSVEFKESNISALIGSSLDILKYSAKEKNVLVNTHLQEINWKVDEYLFKLLLQNMFFNAIKFTPKGGEINIETRIENEQLVFQISDTGYGISEKELHLLFEKYKQTASGLSTRGGSGLGMVIVKNIVDAHKGRINVQSELGKGTCFTIYISKN